VPPSHPLSYSVPLVNIMASEAHHQRLFTLALAASCLLTRVSALSRVATTSQGSEAVAQASDSMVIPEWKLDLASGKGDDWWTRFGLRSVGDTIKSAIWSDGLPVITGSPAQNRQRCPVIKLPDDVVLAANRRGWTTLSGSWTTGSGIGVATWEQNYLSMGFSRDIKKVAVHFRSASTGQMAARTRYFTDKEMMMLYDWKEMPAKATSKAAANSTRSSSKGKTEQFNLAIMDCAGTLMYVVKEKNHTIQVYSRDATLVAESAVEAPVLRYKFADPSSKYLIATAEAPGLNASIKVKDIPRDVEIGEVLPFGMRFQKGGYVNSSALMETEYRWILATAVQALAIYKAQAVGLPWEIITVVETFFIVCFAVMILTVLGMLYSIYRCVYPSAYYLSKDYYGRIADNPFLLVPPRPPQRHSMADAANSRQYAQERGLPGSVPSYGANK